MVRLFNILDYWAQLSQRSLALLEFSDTAVNQQSRRTALEWKGGDHSFTERGPPPRLASGLSQVCKPRNSQPNCELAQA
jgi:hypothetical protein